MNCFGPQLLRRVEKESSISGQYSAGQTLPSLHYLITGACSMEVAKSSGT